ncbi:MAG: M61 family metallopeptidase [Acidobacteria bacterium]|nr:M61 family metallopeptidase [Acidobacteriota bacterium]
MTPRRLLAGVILALAIGLTVAQAQPAGEIVYVVSFPFPEHHWMQVDVTFPDLGDRPLHARMSRSSPGRYAVHEFAKNIFSIEARNGRGDVLNARRVDADEWVVEGHDGSVRLSYRIFGDHADGTYMAVDTTHAHLNMPAAFLWGEGLDGRPIRITFRPPADAGWTVAATQLMPTTDPWTFSAPNLQYFLDSPVELAALVTSRFTVAGPGGGSRAFRVMAHAEASQADVDALASLVERLVREQAAVFGAIPAFEPGHYTFLLDYMPWVDADAMEHRNSTVITNPGLPLSTDGGRRAALDSISHELFHVWNVERIRPADLEPFDFTRANVSCCLWLAEGFTQYYGPLTLIRAGLSNAVPLGSAISVINGSGRQVRSAVEMSQHATFADAGVSNDAHDRSRSFISYYTYGAAIALGLDLTIRERTSGRLSLDDYMRRLWDRFGAASSPAPGVVARPYTLADLRRELGALIDDQTFADDFFARYIEGREVVDYRRLLGLAGFALEPVAAGRGWAGDVALTESGNGLLVGGATAELVPFNSPAYTAGLDAGDHIVTIDGRPATRAGWEALRRGAPGDRHALIVERRDGRRVAATLILAADPALRIVPLESRRPLTDAERTFRDAWLGSRTR